MLLSYQKKTNFTFYIISTVLFTIVGLFVFLIIKIFPTLRLVILDRGDSSCDCIHHASYLASHPYVGTAVLALTVAITLFLMFILFRLVKNILITRKFINSSISHKKKLSAKLKDIADSIGLGNRVVEVNDDQLEAFCYGFLKPVICVSSQLVKSISKRQLRAILLHEKNHLKSYDPLKLFIINTIGQCLIFIPGLNKLIYQFKIDLELSADERATNNFKEISSLSKALIRVAEKHQRTHKSSPKSLAVTFLSIAEARIDRLVSKPQPQRYKPLIPKLIIGLIWIIALFFVVFNSPLLIAKASQMDEMGSAATCHVMPVAYQNDVSSKVDCNSVSKMTCSESSQEDSICQWGSENLMSID